ncbi:MAG: WG repeat-containing protein [Oscillospiraceae bacterium]|nr:WG repeat-containing protein [Oscillospiraceae bacterium]
MKKLTLCITLLAIILIFSACSPPEDDVLQSDISSEISAEENVDEVSVNDNGELSSDSETDTSYDIVTPIILAKSEVKFPDGTTSHYLTLEMVDGRYYENEDTVYKTNYEGHCQLCLYDILSDEELCRIDAQTDPMIFPGEFDFNFVDYTTDGYPDFTLVQRSKENKLYRIFSFYTITPDLSISALPVVELYSTASSTITEPSHALEMDEDGNITIPYYDIITQELVETLYIWDGSKILPSDQFKTTPSVPFWTEPTVEKTDPWSIITVKQNGAWYVEPTFDFDDVIAFKYNYHQSVLEKRASNSTSLADFLRLSFFIKDGQKGLVDQNGNIVHDSSLDVFICELGIVSNSTNTYVGTYGEVSQGYHGHGGSSYFVYDETNKVVVDIGWSLPFEPNENTHIMPVYTATSASDGDYFEYSPLEPAQYVLISPDGTPVSQERFLQFCSSDDIPTHHNLQFSESSIKSTSFEDNIAVQTLDGNWKFIGTNGNDLGLGSFEDAFNFHEGIAAVKKNGKWGFINEKGNTVIPFEYDDTASVYNGLAWVKKDGLWGVMQVFEQS